MGREEEAAGGYVYLLGDGAPSTRGHVMGGGLKPTQPTLLYGGLFLIIYNPWIDGSSGLPRSLQGLCFFLFQHL